jgi:hypothetical protein
VIATAATHLTYIVTQNFEASMEILAQRPEALDVGGTNAMWLDAFWGWTLLGLGRTEALDHLARAARAADQMNARHVSDRAPTAQSLFAERGYASEASALVHYVEAHLRPYRFANPGQAWIQEQIEGTGILTLMPLPSVEKRSEIMALVARTAFSIGRDEHLRA